MKFICLIRKLLSTNQRVQSGEGDATNKEHEQLLVKAMKLWMTEQIRTIRSLINRLMVCLKARFVYNACPLNMKKVNFYSRIPGGRFCLVGFSSSAEKNVNDRNLS
jgi:hypothetical protein